MSHDRLRTVFRWITAGGFIGAGAYHFINPAFYLDVIPTILPNPAFWNALAGGAEIAGGVGLLVPALRRAAAIGLIVMLVGFVWAHVDILIYPDRSAMGRSLPYWLLIVRLPFQAVFIALVYWVGLTPRRTPSPDHPVALGG
ncbi:MAG: DoxX family membrane protein [Planctomycetota bacterium]